MFPAITYAYHMHMPLLGTIAAMAIGFAILGAIMFVWNRQTRKNITLESFHTTGLTSLVIYLGLLIWTGISVFLVYHIA